MTPPGARDVAKESSATASRRASRDAALLVFAGAWAILLAVGRTRLLRDPGTFWHILAGDRIFARGFPRTDWLTFSFAGRPWIAHQWLGECLMSALHRLGGLDALVIAASAALAFLFAWLFARLIAGGLASRWAIVLVALAFLASSLHLHVRPHLLSIFLFAYVDARLVDVDLGRRPLASLWPLPAAFLVWVNAHGAMLGGLGTLGLVLAAWIAAWAVGGRSPIRTRRDAIAVLALGAACLATVAVTPYGLDTARTWAAILESRELPRRIVEHASLARAGGWQVLGLGALYVAAVAATPPRSLRVSALVPLVWLALTFSRIRHAPFFAIAATLSLAELLPRSRLVSWLADRGIEVTSRPAPVLGRRVGVTVAAVAVLALAAVSGWHHSGRGRPPVVARLDPALWPVDLLPALGAAEGELGEGAAVLNDMRLGAFVAYHAPGLRVFVDDRWELFGDEFMLQVVNADPRFLDRWVERSSASLALAEPGSALDRYLLHARAWQRVAASRAATLYRRAAPTADVAARAAAGGDAP